MKRKATVLRFGAAHNAFYLAAAHVLSAVNYDNILIILDGDEYASQEKKMAQMKKILSGTEDDIDQKRVQALSLISQYSLPEGKTPEEFLHSLLLSVTDNSEISMIAREIHSVEDKHQLINIICDQLQEKVETVVPQIISAIENTDEWRKYILNIEEWIRMRQNI